MKQLFAAAAAALFVTYAAAEPGAQVAEYSGTCKIKARKEGATIEAPIRCTVTIQPDSSRKYSYYNITLAGQQQRADFGMVIRVWNGGMLTVDNIPATRKPTLNGDVHLVTAEQVEIRFPAPPKQFAF